MKRTAIILAIFCMMTISSIAQIKIIVHDTVGMSIPDAIIKIRLASGAKLPKELRNGLVTNISGIAQVPVTNGDQLTISSEGFTTKEITVKVTDSTKKSGIKVILTQAQYEVVGYADQSDETSHTNLNVNKSSNIDMYSYLQRELPNVNVIRNGTSYAFQIRGMRSINANNLALVIIDDIEGDIGALTPKDISSITVLKDASSTSIYGGRAAAGAIVIKTKRANSK